MTLPPLPARWYCVSRDGLATLCASEQNAIEMAADCARDYPRQAPYRAVLMCDVADEPNRNGAKKEKHAITAALLRELMAEPVQKPAQKKPSTASQFESVKEAKKVAEAQLSYYRKMMADKSADPVVNQQITGVPIATNPLRISVTRGLRRFRTKQRNARS